jgi:hypothetical protein
MSLYRSYRSPGYSTTVLSTLAKTHDLPPPPSYSALAVLATFL